MNIIHEAAKLSRMTDRGVYIIKERKTGKFEISLDLEKKGELKAVVCRDEQDHVLVIRI